MFEKKVLQLLHSFYSCLDQAIWCGWGMLGARNGVVLRCFSRIINGWGDFDWFFDVCCSLKDGGSVWFQLIYHILPLLLPYFTTISCFTHMIAEPSTETSKLWFLALKARSVKLLEGSWAKWDDETIAIQYHNRILKIWYIYIPI